MDNKQPKRRTMSTVSRKKRYCFLILSVLFVMAVWIDTKITMSTVVFHFFSRTVPSNYYTRSSTTVTSEANTSVSMQGTKTTNEVYVHNRTSMVSHVRFLKVFKAGSTTMQNLLFRFALRHDLVPLLPIKGNHIYSKQRSIAIPASEHFDIFAIHTRYSKQWFDSILPKDSINIAIVRDPAERLISAAYYYRDVYPNDYLKKVPKDNFIHNLVDHPEVYDTARFSKTKNSMGNDFGFSSNVSVNDTQTIIKYLEILNREFKFVMIMEQFEMSLVLLRRLLNWSLQDILFLQANSHSHQAAALKANEIRKLKTTCFLDYALYDFFLKRFEEKVAAESPSIEDEVVNFNSTLKKVKAYCDGKSGNGESLKVGATKWNEEFTISRRDCTLMTTRELKLIDELRQRHRTIYSKPKWSHSRTHIRVL